MQAAFLRIRRPVSAGVAGSFSPGQIVSVSPEIAAALVSVGKAEYTTEPAPAPVVPQPAVETAEAAPVTETAAVKPARTRKTR